MYKETSKAAQLVKHVYMDSNCNKYGIRVSDMQEWLAQGTIGQWTPEERFKNRGRNRGVFYDSINRKWGLFEWFKKGNDNRYYPIDKLKLLVLSENFQPLSNRYNEMRIEILTTK